MFRDELSNIIGVVVVAVVFVFFGTLLEVWLAFWAIKTLFGLVIPFKFETVLAALILRMILSGAVDRAISRKSN